MFAEGADILLDALIDVCARSDGAWESFRYGLTTDIVGLYNILLVLWGIGVLVFPPRWAGKNNARTTDIACNLDELCEPKFVGCRCSSHNL